MSMKIAIAGSGNIGKTLARHWQAAGLDVQFTGRDRILELASASDVLVLSVPWEAAADVLSKAGDLTGKIIIDCTNPVLPALEGLSVTGHDSAGEQIQRLAPNAHVVKCFNTLGWAMIGPGADGFYCGDDAEAKQKVATLVAAAGMRPIDAGPIRNARYLEAMAMLWIDLAIKRGRGATFTFRLQDAS
ncbi:NADPH-dependent F420 reductase [Bryobacterales bacterium F-183]|nr:NADPH-dependent F420 reductase [Bryobacterales bacterium F-183]